MTAPLAGVLAAACAAPGPHTGAGRTVLFVSARAGEGVSTTARGAAEEAGAPTLLIDLDLKRNTHAAHYEARGKLGPALDARAGGASFYRVVTADKQAVREQALTRHLVTPHLQVTAFNAGVVPPGGRVQISGDGAYWDALRAMGGVVAVDAPALERNPVALKLARHMDAVVLVVSPAALSAPAAMEARAALTQAGANVVGIVFAQASAETIAIDRFTRRAAG